MTEHSKVLTTQVVSNIYSEAIEKKRRCLLETAQHYGLYAPQTLRCSQELDQLIIEIQEKHSPLSARVQD